ncbi:MAG: biotin--[acetyl-CoA-carboxylase] ligase [Phycisphaerales bacterium]
MSDDLSSWAAALKAAIARDRPRIVDRVVVLAEVASTQDEARARAAGRPGLLVIAARQTAGRGRLGRAWLDAEGEGLAATFALAAPAPSAQGRVSIAAGLAACRACESAIAAPLRLRWPNDVVAPDGRKLAGVLIEARDGLLLVGIGINVRQTAFPPTLAAASLHQLGSSWSRADASLALLRELDACLALGDADLLREWTARDALRGTRRTFLHNGIRHTGLVESISPAAEICLRLDDGRSLSLPAATTSLLHE